MVSSPPSSLTATLGTHIRKHKKRRHLAEVEEWREIRVGEICLKSIQEE